MYSASAREAARKKIQAKVTRAKVVRAARANFRRGARSRCVSAERRFQIGSVRIERTRYAPCKAPQITYVQAAPCHKPLIRKVMNRLKTQRRLGTRLPPRGIYT